MMDDLISLHAPDANNYFASRYFSNHPADCYAQSSAMPGGMFEFW
jgi:hypothetical protein